MSKIKETIWSIEPHTSAKHEILRRYLGAWFAILGSTQGRIVYIDGFCGPGRYKNEEPGSPIVALEVALSHQQRLRNREVVFVFIDERADRLEQLRDEISRIDLPSNFKVHVLHEDFQSAMCSIFSSLGNKQLAPTFAFIDPFGFKGIPFKIVTRLLKNPRTEIFINIMIDHINRFVESPDSQVRQHIVDLFGTLEVLEVIQSVSNRSAALRNLYQQQLKETAQFVRYFEMQDTKNRPIYYLFFATNHRLGHIKMKEAFWKVDSQSGFKFSDATNPNQPVLLQVDPAESLTRELMRHFAGSKIDSQTIKQFVEDETPYTGSHMKAALRILEDEGKIIPEPIKADGKKRRKNTYPDGVTIQFA